MPTRSRLQRFSATALLTALGAVAMTGCQWGKPTLTTEDLRKSLLAENLAKLEGRAQDVRIEQDPSELKQSLERVLKKAKESDIELPEGRKTVEGNIKAADQDSGPGAYAGKVPDLGKDLSGEKKTPTVVIDLRSAVRKAIEHNLDLSVARISPQIGTERVTQAKAVFDSVLFAGFDYINQDTPRPPGAIPGLSGDQQFESYNLSTGVRKTFTTGGTVTAQAQVNRSRQSPSFFGVTRFYDADVLLQISQPLLRGFGSEVNEANIKLAGIARKADYVALRSAMIDLAVGVEQAYWQLSAARNALLIQERLYAQTVEMRDKLEKRFGFDLLLADLNEVNARVGQRYADVLRARQNVRKLSDQLKGLINDPDLPVIGQAVLLPAESPTEQAITFSLLDQVTTALKHRPEIETALLAIDDAEIRRIVAANAQLPTLNLVASTTLNGLDVDDGVDALGQTTELDYIDYAIGIEFERPWGNRSARSSFKERVLERKQALQRYKSTAQQVTLQVKDAMRLVALNYRLIAIARSQRRASSLSLQVAKVQLEQGGRNENETYTTRIDRVLSRQDALAQAELAESQALSDYMIAISALQQATGTSLKQAGVKVDKTPE